MRDDCSINIGPVHLVSFSSEYYYYVQYGWEQIIRQYEWMERDLAVSWVSAHSMTVLNHTVKFRQLDIEFSQGSAAADLRWDGRFYSSFFLFIWECTSETIIKIGRRLAKLLPKEKGALFMVYSVQYESKKNPPWGFLTFFLNGWAFLISFFTHLLYIPIYARLQIFIQLSSWQSYASTHFGWRWTIWAYDVNWVVALNMA